MKRSVEWLEHHTLSGRVQLRVERASRVGIQGGRAIQRSACLIRFISGSRRSSEDLR